MRVRHQILPLILFVSLFTGCLPEKRVTWSPDGERAAVATPRGLYFIDATGVVLPPRLANTSTRCEWFSDGKRLAVVHTQLAKHWSDVKPLYTTEQVAAIVRHAGEVRSRALAYQGDWDKFDLDPQHQLSNGMQAAALLCLRDDHSEGMAEKLGDKWREIQNMDVTVWMLQTYAFKADALEPGEVLVRSLDEIRQPHVSPNGKSIAFLMNSADAPKDSLSLFIVPTGGSAARSVADNVSIDFSWSPDSRSLAYISCPTAKSDDKGMIQLGSLTTVSVADESGAILTAWAERKDRVGLLFNGALSVKWLRDGRLIFSSVEVTLPATPRDMPQQWSLFVLDPRMPASVNRVLARDVSQPRDLSLPLFELSPDESKVLLPGPKGHVSLYDFASGEETELIGIDDPKGQTRCLSSWRNNSEICLVTPSGKPNDPKSPSQVVLWKAGKTTTLSESWPEEMKEEWLIKE